MPLERLWPRNGLSDSILVQTDPVGSNIHQFAVLNTALIRDCLVAGGAERLAEACNREPWLVTLAEVGSRVRILIVVARVDLFQKGI